MFSFLRPVLDPLEWACLEQFGLSLIACGLALDVSFVHVQMGLVPLSKYESIATEQTADNVISACPIHRAPREMAGLTVLDDDTQ